MKTMDLHELFMKIKITSACIGYAVEEAMKYDNDEREYEYYN